MTSRTLWGSGLWSRFALVIPDSEAVYAPRPPKLAIPLVLVQGLRRVFELFPIPRAEWQQEVTESGVLGRPWVALYNQQPPSEVQCAPGVAAALDRYTEVVGFRIPKQGLIEPILKSSYARLGTQLLKVAMLLATLDAVRLPVVIELRHVARALVIVEGWREYLHVLWETLAATEEAVLTQKITHYLGKAHGSGLTARELCQATHRPSSDVRQALALLQEAGQIVAIQIGRKTVWLLSEGVAGVAARATPPATLPRAAPSAESESVAV